MIPSDFLSKFKYYAKDPHEIIPLSFTTQEVLHTRYYNIHAPKKETFWIKPDLTQRPVVQFCIQYMV